MTENFISRTKAARDFCEAIRTIASKPENMKNLECYLAAHFETWLEKWTDTPENLTNCVYSTEADALASWGKYSNKPVVMPDGSTTTPAHYFGLERIEDVFIPWSDVKGERWPGEY